MFSKYFEKIPLATPPAAPPGRFAPWGGGFVKNFQKNQAPGDLGRAIFEPGSKNQPWGTWEGDF